MSAQNSAFSWQEDKLALKILLWPRTSQNECSGLQDARIRIGVTAPPVWNQANVECVKFFAKLLKTSKTCVSVIREQTSRACTVEVPKLDLDCSQKILTEFVAD